VSAPRLHPDDLERLAELIAAKLRGENVQPANEAPIAVTERHLRIAADKLSKPRKIRGR
jgi:hypothetical protein